MGGIEFIGRLERKARAGLQGQRIDLRSPIEYRPHVAIPPGIAGGRGELAVGKEIQPLAVCRECRRGAFIAIAGQHRLARAIGGDQDDLRPPLLAVGAGHGEVATVRRPAHRGIGVIDTEPTLIELAQRARGQIEHEQALLLVVEGQRLAVGRREQVPAPGIGVSGQGFAGTRTVGRESPDLLAAADVADRIDPFAVRARHRRPRTRPGRHGHVDATARVGGGQGNGTARGQRHAAAVLRQGQVLEIVERLFEPARAALFEVADDIDRNDAIGTCRDVEDPDVGSVLVDDAAVLQLRIDHVELTVRGQGPAIAAIGRHAPEIVAAALVAEMVEATVPPHRSSNRCVEIRQ